MNEERFTYRKKGVGHRLGQYYNGLRKGTDDEDALIRFILNPL